MYVLVKFWMLILSVLFFTSSCGRVTKSIFSKPGVSFYRPGEKSEEVFRSSKKRLVAFSFRETDLCFLQ
jgi:hypothetical protein